MQTNKDKLNTVTAEDQPGPPDAEDINTLLRTRNAIVAQPSALEAKESSQLKGPRLSVRMAGRRPSRRCCWRKLLTDQPKITYTTKAGVSSDGVDRQNSRRMARATR